MDYLFRDKAFPMFNEQSGIVDALHNPQVKSVSLSDPSWSDRTSEIKGSFRHTSTPELGRAYTGEGRIVTGEKRYHDNFTSKEIFDEAAKAGIEINASALQTLTTQANTLRTLFEEVYAEYDPSFNGKVIGRLLFTPKNGQGRSPGVHVDSVLAMHSVFDLAPLMIYGGEFGDHIWEEISKTSEKHEPDYYLQQITRANDEEFYRTKPGHATFLKGASGKALMETPYIRKSVCPHASDSRIQFQGQASVIFFPEV